MDYDSIIPGRQTDDCEGDDSDDEMAAAAAEAARQITAAAGQETAGPSQPRPLRKRMRSLKEVLRSGPATPPNTPWSQQLQDSSSHGLNAAAAAYSNRPRTGRANRASAETQRPVSHRPAEATGAKTRRTGGAEGLDFSLALPRYHSLVFQAQALSFSLERWPSRSPDGHSSGSSN